MQPAHLAVPVLAALALLTSGASATTTWASGAEFRIEAVAGDDPQTDLSLELPGGARQAGRIVVYAPPGFTIYPVRPPGSLVGSAFMTAANSSYGTPTYATLAGDLVAQQPAPQPGCDVPAPIGLWQLELSLLGQPFDFPLLLAGPAPSDPRPAAVTIVLCVPAVPPAGSALPIRSLDLSLDGIAPPTRDGAYVWRAFVTPVAPDGRTLRPEAAYELRAVVPVPHRLTLTGGRQQSTHVAVLRGRLTADGAPRTGVPIRIVRLARAVTPGSVSIRDAVVGWTTTNRSGVYSFHARALGTTTFIAVAEPTAGDCHGASAAPAGCLSTTYPGTRSDPLTVA